MNRTYDKQMIVDWLQQFMGELKAEQLELEGKSVPPGVRQGAAGALYIAYLRDPDGNKLCALHRMV